MYISRKLFSHLNRPQSSTPALLTPTAKRKNLLLQHQQRSSMDTDALELEDHFSDQVSFPLFAFKSINMLPNIVTDCDIKKANIILAHFQN